MNRKEFAEKAPASEHADIAEARFGGRIETGIIAEGLIEPGHLQADVDGIGKHLVTLDKGRRGLVLAIKAIRSARPRRALPEGVVRQQDGLRDVGVPLIRRLVKPADFGPQRAAGRRLRPSLSHHWCQQRQNHKQDVSLPVW